MIWLIVILSIVPAAIVYYITSKHGKRYVSDKISETEAHCYKDILDNYTQIDKLEKTVKDLSKLVADNAAPYKFDVTDEVEPTEAFKKGCFKVGMGFYGHPEGTIFARRHEYKDGKRTNEYQIFERTLFGKGELKWFSEYTIQLKKPVTPVKIKPVARKRTVTRKRK